MTDIANPEFDAFVKNNWEPYIRDAKLSWHVDERIARQHILPEFAHFKLLDISADLVKAWYHTLLSKGLAVTTCNRILYVLKNIFNFACKNGFLKNRPNPLEAVQWVKTQKKEEKAIHPADIAGIYKSLKKSKRIEAKVILMMIYTGAAKNEILHAKWDNYLKEKNLLVVEKKGGKDLRKLWLPKEAVNILNSIPKISGTQWIFPGRDKIKPFSDIFLFWDKLRCKFGLKYLRINEYRTNWIKSRFINGVTFDENIGYTSNFLR